MTKFDYKLDCSLRLQLHLIYFYWMRILINSELNYIFFLYLLCLLNYQKNKDQ